MFRLKLAPTTTEVEMVPSTVGSLLFHSLKCGVWTDLRTVKESNLLLIGRTIIEWMYLKLYYAGVPAIQSQAVEIAKKILSYTYNSSQSNRPSASSAFILRVQNRWMCVCVCVRNMLVSVVGEVATLVWFVLYTNGGRMFYMR